MQGVFIEKPYEFVPRLKSSWQQNLLLKTFLLERILRKNEGVEDYECRHLDRLQQSLSAGHGILLAPNHPRTADPMAIYFAARELRQPFYTMASWHLFNHGWLKRRIIRYMGAFSLNREGMDRQAIDEAIEILRTADRPLVMFSEGTTSRTNDQLMAFMEGPAFIARTAAKRRLKEDGGKVVVHPVALKYLYQGDIEQTAHEVLTSIEERLTWSPQDHLPLIDRLVKAGDMMLTLKELEFDARAAADMSLRERQSRMVDHLLCPLEEEWLGKTHPGEGVALRVKNLRVQIFPELSRQSLDLAERKRRWQHIRTSYIAQQIDQYPDQYVAEFPSVDRILETLEKFEEDLTNKARIHGKLKVVIEFGEAIEVSTQRQRGLDEDPLITEVRHSINAMLNRLQSESKMYPVPAARQGTTAAPVA